MSLGKPHRAFERTLPSGIRWGIFLAGAAVALLVFCGQRSDAHKLVTSKYDYNRDVFPLLRDHCGACHVQGGPAPMSLITYADAVPWAESIRDEVTAGRMPPWPVDPAGPAIKGGYPISARDIDRIVEWAAGGTPEGADAKLPEVKFNPQWKLGPPDLKIPMEAAQTLAPGMIEQTADFSFPVSVSEVKWLKAADLMPGTASIVRDAVISIENGPVLALWQPGGNRMAAPSGAAFKLDPGAKIHLQIHYKKHFDQEQSSISDKSTIGLYFTDAPLSGHELQSLAVALPQSPSASNASRSFSATLAAAGRIVALRPMLDHAYGSLAVDAKTPTGTGVPLLRLTGPRPQWFQRYWLQEPVELPAGSQITVSVTPLSDDSEEPKSTRKFPLQVAVDYVPQ